MLMQRDEVRELVGLPVMSPDESRPYLDPSASMTMHEHYTNGVMWRTADAWPEQLAISGEILRDEDPMYICVRGVRLLIRTANEWGLYEFIGRDYYDRFYCRRMAYGKHHRHLKQRRISVRA